MKHITHLRDLGITGSRQIVDQAIAFKGEDPGPNLSGKLLAMVFFNRSLRTRMSFESCLLRSGGATVTLDVDGGIWPLEISAGVQMNGLAAEHIREAVPVISRYVDAIAVRTFARPNEKSDETMDPIINGFREYAEVPVLSMESAREHPFQGLADLMTLKEKFGFTQGLPVTLSWAPHVKPLPRAVPNSFLLTAAAFGCDITIAHPPGFELAPDVLSETRQLCSETKGKLRVSNDQKAALEGRVALYAKSWGPRDAANHQLQNEAWRIGLEHFRNMRKEAIFMHCLPIRRNVVAVDDVVDREPRVLIDQAENRMHVQRAALDWLWNH